MTVDPRRESWIYVSPPSGPLTTRLFCLPYAGGGASAYRLWPTGVPAGVEVCRVQFPGRESRLNEPPFERIDDLVRVLLEVLGPCLDEPFALFGHSMGALVAFELALAARRELGVEPVHFFASAQRAPRCHRVPDIHTLPDAEFVRAIRERYGGIPDAVLREPDLMALMVPLLRADLAVCESFDRRRGEPLACPITAFGGAQDPWVGREHLVGWEEETSEDFTLRMFPGDHLFINGHWSPVVAAVSDALTRLPG